MGAYRVHMDPFSQRTLREALGYPDDFAGWGPPPHSRRARFFHDDFDANAPGREPPKYVPTAGMLRALCGDEHATDLDFDRCRLRGLIDGDRWPTEAGREVIVTEIARRKAVQGG